MLKKKVIVAHKVSENASQKKALTEKSKGIQAAKKMPVEKPKTIKGKIPESWSICADKCKVCHNRMSMNLLTGERRCSFITCPTRQAKSEGELVKAQAKARLEKVVGKDGEGILISSLFKQKEQIEKVKPVIKAKKETKVLFPFIKDKKPVFIKIAKIAVTQECIYRLKKLLGIEGEEIAFDSEEAQAVKELIEKEEKQDNRMTSLLGTIIHMLEKDKIQEVVLY